MANVSVTYSFTNSTTADADEVNTNFTDIINGTSDGSKDFSISALTLAGTFTANGNVNLGNATSDDITITGRVASDIDPKTAATNTLGDATQTWQSISLDNTSTDGGAVYFDGGTTEFLKSSADGTALNLGGFTSLGGVARITEKTATEGVEIQGSTDGTDPSAGYVGEVLRASTVRASAVSLTTNVTANVTSLLLTTGRWLVSPVVGFISAATTVLTATDSALSKTSATLPASSTIGVPASGEVWIEKGYGGATIADWDVATVLPTFIIKISASDTFYLVAKGTFTTSTLTAYGSIEAVRLP